MVYNPFAGWNVSGSWYDHRTYSAGGIDYPLGYNTPLPAPASGTLRASGGSGEFAAGWVGSAGRRSVLTLDTPATRLIPAESSPPEGGGAMVAIVIQHQAAFASEGHYNAGAIFGYSGASADGENYGGDTHLHIHGLNSSGQRVDFLKFIDGTTTPPNPVLSKEDDMKPLYITDSVDGNGIPGWALLNTRTGKLVTLRYTGQASEQAQADVWGKVWGSSPRITRYDMLTAIDAIQKTL